MTDKLHLTRFYTADLETLKVDCAHSYASVSKALDGERKRRMENGTSIGEIFADRGQRKIAVNTGRHYLAHEGKPWIIPSTEGSK